MALAAIAFVAGCDDVGSPPPPIEGTYALELVGNSQLPVNLTQTTTLHGATLVVNTDGSFTETRETSVSGGPTQTSVAAGNWTPHSQHSWLFVFTSATRTDTATITSAISLSLRTGGRDWLYQK